MRWSRRTTSRETINPSDADLQAFFKQNAAQYANAIPETRKIEYVAFDASNLPGGKPAVSDARGAGVLHGAPGEYKTEEQVKTRHILITCPRARTRRPMRRRRPRRRTC